MDRNPANSVAVQGAAATELGDSEKKPVIAGGTAQVGARLGVLVAILLWASQYPMTHDLGQRWDPYIMLLIRFTAAGILFYGLEKFWADRRVALRSPTFAEKALIGGAFAVFGVFFTVGLTIGNPVTVSAVAAIAPISASFVAWAIEAKRPTAGILLALVLAVPGGVLASVDFSTFSVQINDVLGALFVICAQLCWASYSLLGQRWLKGWSQVAITGGSVRWCCPFLLAAFLVAHFAGATYVDYQTSPLYDAALFAVLTLGALVAGVALWNFGVSRLGLPVTAMHMNLVPVFAIVIAYAMGIAPRPEQLVGTALVIAGVVAAQSIGRRTPRRKTNA